MNDINYAKALRLIANILRSDAVILLDNSEYQDFIRLKTKVSDQKPILNADIKSLQRVYELVNK